MECRNLYADDGESPPCEGCRFEEIDLLPDNAEAVGIWCILDAHGRDYRGMDGWPMMIRIEAMRAECDRTSDPEGVFDKVLLVEREIYPSRYKRKDGK